MEQKSKAGGRLSAVLKGEMGLSTGLMNRLKWSQRILVNGVPQRTNYQVQPGDVVTVLLDEKTPEYPPEDIPLTIIYEDSDILVVDKPAGMLIHPSAHKNTGTLANGVLFYYEKNGEASAFHPVTRLDRDTFGLVLLGKNAHVHKLLNEVNQRGELVKVYHGLIYGAMTPEAGTIDLPIARRPKPSLLRFVDESGQRSLTEYETLERGAGWSLLGLRPVTGRTHQLRVHCAHVGCPILGDPQYGSRESLALSEAFHLSYQQLCAYSLEFPHPMTGKPMKLRSSMDVWKPEE